MATHDAALAAFEAGQIGYVCRGFEEVAGAVPGDKVAAGYLTREPCWSTVSPTDGTAS